jgi:hypothetical protein
MTSASAYLARMSAVLSLAVVLGSSAPAQQDSILRTPKPTFKPFVFYGGNVYLSFGSGTTIGVSPMVGMYFTPQLSAGVGVTYIYYTRDDLKSNVYGGRLMARYDIIPQIYAKTEFSYLVYNDTFKGVDIGSTSVPYLFVGGGYRQPIGPRSYLELDIMFDVLRNENSQYNNWEPLISVGVSVGV